MVNLKSGASVLIMLLNKSLTRVHSQKDPRMHFGESYTLTQRDALALGRLEWLLFGLVFVKCFICDSYFISLQPLQSCMPYILWLYFSSLVYV